ncbi:MAG: hypothetical protein Q8N99_01035 [Nanoarchaeota archaeon]|nr:hypothetical protein [Nanoarchaeota archaeon]
MSKKRVPEELPELVSEDLEKKSDPMVSEIKNAVNGKKVEDEEQFLNTDDYEYTLFEPEKIDKTDSVNEELEKPNIIERINKLDSEEEIEPYKSVPEISPFEINNKNEDIKRIKTNDIKKEEKIGIPKEEETDRGGFFTELEQDLKEEINDLDKLEGWYKNKFLPRDIVSDMRHHWEDKKKGSVMRILGKNFQSRISEKTTKLQDLEKEWQNIYFNLIEKEEEIRGQEKELKKMLAEFVEICKRKNKENREKSQ